MRPEVKRALSAADYEHGDALLSLLAEVDSTPGNLDITALRDRTSGELVNALLSATERGWVENVRAAEDDSVKYTITESGLRAIRCLRRRLFRKVSPI